MAIPEDHKEKVKIYFDQVAAIEEALKQNFLNNGGTEQDAENNQLEFFKQADTVVKAKLGYSYYPWPF